MKSLIEIPTPTLVWRKSTSTPPDFELCGNAGVFATLTFVDKDCTLARIKTVEGVWTIKHLGILAPAVTLREEGGKTNVAIFHPHALRHGKLQFDDGATFDWIWHHDSGGGGSFMDPGGTPLVRLHGHPGRDLTSASEFDTCDVDLNLGSFARRRHTLLAAFGWYLILFDHLKERDLKTAETTLRM
jgi:hypothetical protein